MMPDLGKYAAEVLMAYGVSGVLLLGIIAQSWRRAHQARRALQAVEKQDG